MKRRAVVKIFASLFIASLLIGGYACSGSDNYLDEYEVRRMIEEAIRKNNEQLEFTQWKIITIPAKKADWIWNDNQKQYEAVYDLPELTSFIYEKGAVLGYLFLGKQGVDEVQKPLPYTFSYPIEGTNDSYSETISYDVQYKDGGKSTIAFFIQASDLAREDAYLVDYNFRVILIW